MSVSSAIDLSLLPPPDVVESLSYEEILAAMLADMRDPERTNGQPFTTISEADPAYKVLEVSAYRELLLRQRVNEAARAVMLAYAMDGDLDQLGAWFDVERLTLTPADPEHGIPAVMESDIDYKRRIQLAPQGFSVAGPEGAYIYHALSADSRVMDASATSPQPGYVVVTILSRVGDGTASQDLLDAVTTRFMDDAVRPMTDYVTVQSAIVHHYRVISKAFTFSGPDPEVALAEAKNRMTKYAADSHRLNRVPTPSGIDAALQAPGIERVEVSEPSTVLEKSRLQAYFCDDIVVENGGIHE
jgi:phage-related baseplate assembly protein